MYASKKADPFYKSGRWRRVRDAALARDGYVCQVSKRFGKMVPADTVHHVYPRELFPEYQYCMWNLVSLAGSVHDEMHDRVTGDLTGKGKDLLRRTARRHGMEVPARYRA